MDIATAQRHLKELRMRPMYQGKPEFGYFRYDEMLNEEVGYILHIEGLVMDRDAGRYFARKTGLRAARQVLRSRKRSK